ncbi:hypothetical protein [uncultured Mucilaginibacter sp.]|uniref:hypothetical protein n=1 Tax=uncultured Mucilaginibacter sp. TaxID=797541 RepID=UPI002627EA46|nr:hypothetical protein [uncultured Mucilaginibacter sp.]
METILLQINDQNAYKLIEGLEALHLVKVLKKNIEPKKKLSERFAGSLKLTDAQYNDFQNLITEGRNEWNRDI